MQRHDHPLRSPSLGLHTTLSSLHFGTPGSGPKVYIQASLHAEELPGMLAAYHLRPLLEAADVRAQIQGEVVLVPMANPVGAAQRLQHKPMGRFEFNTGENFNRHYPDFFTHISAEVLPTLGSDAQANVALVRQAMRRYLEQWTPDTELASLRRQLLLLSFDADYVLDLHCDCEAVLHFYCEESCWPQLAPLAHYLQSRAILLAKNSGSSPFDESLSGVWWRLAEALAASGSAAPLPQACLSTTIELRGEAQVEHGLAAQDAQAIANYLRHIGVLRDTPAAALPSPACDATPLAGSETLYAPVPGLVVFAAEPGQQLRAGDLVAEVIDPVAHTAQRMCAGVDGLLYARIRDRYVTTGCELAKIAGAVAFRSGELLGA
jgi:predicted deacylase